MKTNPARTLVSDVVGLTFGRPRRQSMSMWRGPIWLGTAVLSTVALPHAVALGPIGPLPEIRRDPQSQVAAVGETVRLTVDVFSIRPVTYQWYFNGSPMDGETREDLVLYEVDLSDRGDYSLVVANVSGGVGSSSATVGVALPPVVVPFGALWRYYDDGSGPEPGWQLESFDDDEWSQFAPQSGKSISNQVVTTYFRRCFDYDPRGLGATESDPPTTVVLELVGDEGLIVYFNGREVARDNMPEGQVTASTLALPQIRGPERSQVRYFRIDLRGDPSLLVEGRNVVALEIHKTLPDSSDVGFDLELMPEVPNSPGLLDNAFDPASGPDGPVRALVAQPDGQVVIGGDFTMVGQTSRRHYARLNTNGAVDPKFGQGEGADGRVRAAALLEEEGAIALGGEFQMVQGQLRRGLAFLDWHSGDLLPQQPVFEGTVAAIQVADRVIYVGGSFSSVDGLDRSNLVALDATSGAVRDWAPSLNGAVEGLWLCGDTVFVAGNFTMVGGENRQGLAALDRFTGQVHSWHPDPVGQVRALCVARDTIYVGGDFNRIAGQPQRRFAAISWPGGAIVDWRHEMDGPISALALWDAMLYLGGEFARIDGQTPRNLSGLNVEAAAEADPAPMQVKVDGPVLAVAVDARGGLFISGDFSQVNGETRRRLARLRGLPGVSPAAPHIAWRQNKGPEPRLRVTGPPGRTYGIEMGTNWGGGWQRLTTNSAPNGVLDYTHREVDNFRVRIYRAFVF